MVNQDFVGEVGHRDGDTFMDNSNQKQAMTTVTPDNALGYGDGGAPGDVQLSDDAGMSINLSGQIARSGSVAQPLPEVRKAKKKNFEDTLSQQPHGGQDDNGGGIAEKLEHQLHGPHGDADKEQEAGDDNDGTNLGNSSGDGDHLEGDNDALSMDHPEDALETGKAAEDTTEMNTPEQEDDDVMMMMMLQTDKQSPGEGRQHHLLRHSLPSEQRGSGVLQHFGAESISEAAKQIKKMSQRDLQAKFRAVYGTKTFSNNNNWLRRKLFEAIGMDPGKSTAKKGVAGGQRRRRTAKPAAPKAPSRYSRRARMEQHNDEDHNNVAEALLALADVAHMSDSVGDGVVPPGHHQGPAWGQRSVPIPNETTLPAAAPLFHTNTATLASQPDQVDFSSYLNDYLSQVNIRQHGGQLSDAQAAMMAAMVGGHGANPVQMMQRVQQAQLAMIMSLQSNPAAFHALLAQSASMPHMMQYLPEMYARMCQEYMAAAAQSKQPA